MDDLVFAGALGITGICITAIILLCGAYSIAGLVYTAFVSGQYNVILFWGVVIVSAGSMYLAAGYWLRKTERI